MSANGDMGLKPDLLLETSASGFRGAFRIARHLS